jgi:hypothetical protein
MNMLKSGGRFALLLRDIYGTIMWLIVPENCAFSRLKGAVESNLDPSHKRCTIYSNW